MRALIVFYTGSAPHEGVAESIGTLSFVDSVIQVNAISDNKLADIIVNATKSPKKNTEDGDNAALFIAGAVRSMSNPTLSFDVIKYLTTFEKDHSDDMASTFVRAASIIAQGSPVSQEIATKTGLTKSARNTISTLYDSWKNG